MTILEQVDAYRDLLDKKECLADATKEKLLKLALPLETARAS